MRRRKRRIKRGIYVSTKTGQVCKYRSGWERSYMFYLDNDPLVKDFIYEPFAIPYVSNKRTGKIRKYYPDLLVRMFDGSKHLIEIKPKRRVGNPTNVKKALAAVEWCLKQGDVKFGIVTEVELKALDLL